MSEDVDKDTLREVEAIARERLGDAEYNGTDRLIQAAGTDMQRVPVKHGGRDYVAVFVPRRVSMVEWSWHCDGVTRR